MSIEHDRFVEDCTVEDAHFKDAIASLPTKEAHELLSYGVCIRCVFRILGRSCYLNTPIPSVDYLFGAKCPDAPLETLRFQVAEPQLCPACYGILQLLYRDTGNSIVKMQSAQELALLVIDLVKKQKHFIDGFCVELSLPHIVSDSERKIRSYIENKYSTASWFVRDYMSVKEAFKFMITTSLDLMQCLENGPRPLCIRFTYSVCTQTSTVNETCLDRSNKKLKGDRLNSPTSKTLEKDILIPFKSILEEVREPFSLVVSCSRPSVCIIGRYLKFSRNVSQSRWIIDDERIGEASVEEIIGSNVLPVFCGDSYKFHAAGREDIDVRMLGTGRPFLIEIQNPRQFPSSNCIKEIETSINDSNNKLIAVRSLRIVSNEGWAMMKEGEAEKQKQYCALVWVSRPVEEKDVQTFASLTDMKISQKTPIRVLHRRSPLTRDKIIHWMKIEIISENPHYFLLHLCSQAGTYIKEFVHGDLGRTHPSVGSLMGCTAEILQLDVTDVKMDGFQ